MKTKPYTTEEVQEKILAFLESIDKSLKQLLKDKQQPADLDVINNQQLIQALSISKRAAAEWRKDGTLRYTKIKGQIFYKKSDVKAMLQDNFKRE